LKVTLQQFYLPDGDSTQLTGVPADVLLPSITSHMDVGEGDLKFALEHDKVKSAKHVLYNMVPADLIETIRKNSMERVKANDEFNDLLRRVGIYVKQKEQNTVSLNEEKFMARRKELDSEKEEEAEQMEAALSGEEVYHDYFYNQEVMNITHDYVEGLRRQNLARAN
jgi:carboxyl-terminal processing protease